MRLGALLTSRTAAFAPCCYLAEGFLPLLVAARDGHSPSRSARTSPEGSLRVARFGRSREVWTERPAPCAGRSHAMVAVRPIVPTMPITKRLGFGAASEAMSAGRQPQVAGPRCE
jgi:hypothetical protein